MATKLNPRLVKRVFELEKQAGDRRDKWTGVAQAINKEFGTGYNRLAVANIHKRYAHGATAPDRFIPHEADTESTGFLERVAEIVRTSKKTAGNVKTDVWEQSFTDAQGLREILSDKELFASATIDTDKPIALSWLGDWHIGSPSTDYKKLYGDARTIMRNPRMYCCIAGDRADMFVPGFRDASAVSGQIIPPDIQLDAVDSLLSELGDSIIAAIGGNHDIMAKRKTGIDSDRWMRRRHKFSYMPHGGVLTLTVGKQRYEILWKHTYRFQSTLNQFNSHRQMMNMLAPNADIVVQEHVHNCAMQTVEVGSGENRRTVVSITTGTYKIDDGFSMDFYKEGTPGPQTVILYPDKKKIVGMHGYDALNDAATYLKAV